MINRPGVYAGVNPMESDARLRLSAENRPNRCCHPPISWEFRKVDVEKTVGREILRTNDVVKFDREKPELRKRLQLVKGADLDAGTARLESQGVLPGAASRVILVQHHAKPRWLETEFKEMT